MAIGRLLFSSLPRALKSILVLGFCVSIAASLAFVASLLVQLDEGDLALLQVAGPIAGGLLLFGLVNRRLRSAESLVSFMAFSLIVAGGAQAFAYFWPRQLPLPDEKLELCPSSPSSEDTPVAAGCSP